MIEDFFTKGRPNKYGTQTTGWMDLGWKIAKAYVALKRPFIRARIRIKAKWQ